MLKSRYSKSSRTRSELMRLRKVEKCLMVMMIGAAIALPVVALSQYLGPTEQAVYTPVSDVELTDVLSIRVQQPVELASKTAAWQEVQ